MPPFENPTTKELKETLEDADLPVGDDIEARLGKDPKASSKASSKDEEE